MTKRSALSIPGIYTITNTTTGRVYIGQTTNFRTRWMNHRRELRNGTHRNIYLQNAWVKYGEAAFEFAIHTDMSAVPQEKLAETLNRAEINLLSSLPATYNLMEAGNSGIVASTETRAILSRQRLAMWSDPIFKANRSAATKKLYKDPLWKAARDAAVKEGVNMPEVKAKVSARALALWEDPSHRAAMSETHAKLWEDPSYRAQQSASRKASWANPESRARRVAALKKSASDPAVLAARKSGIRKVAAKMGATRKALWADPEFRARIIAAQKAGRAAAKAAKS